MKKRIKPLRISNRDKRDPRGAKNTYKIRAEKHVEGTFYSDIKTHD